MAEVNEYAHPDTNTWYAIQNLATNAYLACGGMNDSTGSGAIFLTTDGTAINALWQFTDEQDLPIIDTNGTAPSYLMRPQSYGSNYNGTDYCMNIQDGNNPVLSPCQDGQNIWNVAVPSDDSFAVIYANNGAGYLSYLDDTGGALITYTNDEFADVDETDYQWVFSSVAAINDPQWSSVLFGYATTSTSFSGTTTPDVTSSTTTATTTITISPTSLPTTASPNTQSGNGVFNNSTGHATSQVHGVNQITATAPAPSATSSSAAAAALSAPDAFSGIASKLLSAAGSLLLAWYI